MAKTSKKPSTESSTLSALARKGEAKIGKIEAGPTSEPFPPPTAGPDAVSAFLAEFISSDDRSDTWVRDFIARIYDAGRAAPKMRTRAPKAPRPDRGPTKRAAAAALLSRPEGCTARDILNATGWPAVSVQALAKASGLTLRQEKDGKVTRYFGTTA